MSRPTIVMAAIWFAAAVASFAQVPGVHMTHDNDPTVQRLLAEARAAQLKWMNGDSGAYANLMAHTPAFSIFGPFGGPSPPGWSEQSAKAQAAAARQFQGAVSSSIDLVQAHVSDNLIVLVMIERNVGKFASFDRPQPWDLRVTQVYERDGTNWRIIHRHADPLLARRDLAATLQLMQPQ